MDKYLEHYAEAGGEAVEGLPHGKTWARSVVIPVHNERPDILRPLPPAPGRSLMILVVNEAGGASPRITTANRDFVEEVERRFESLWQGPAGSGLTLLQDPETGRDVLLVDRCHDRLRLPAGGGVGLARKTGADLAARLIRDGRVRSPWIHCSDADVCLPGRYFSASEFVTEDEAVETAALVYPFRHVGEPGDRIGRATRLYEYSLRYYVAGLAWAGSPYAFHTIGSTIAVNAVHYARVRGFPRREAGEDFYLLNKLAKVGAVRQLSEEADCGPVEIAARKSDRVPFGTGAAVGAICRMGDPPSEFLLYHPEVFDMLREWLASLPEFWRTRSDDPGAILDSPGLEALSAALAGLGISKALRHALRQSADEGQFQRQLHTWFDAFRTLKLIHHLRDHHLASIGFEALMTEEKTARLSGFEPRLSELQDTIRRDWPAN